MRCSVIQAMRSANMASHRMCLLCVCARGKFQMETNLLQYTLQRIYLHSTYSTFTFHKQIHNVIPKLYSLTALMYIVVQIWYMQCGQLSTNTYPIAAGKCHKDSPNPTISCHVYIMAYIVVIFCLLNNMRSYWRLKWLSLVHHQSVTNSCSACWL